MPSAFRFGSSHAPRWRAGAGVEWRAAPPRISPPASAPLPLPRPVPLSAPLPLLPGKSPGSSASLPPPPSPPRPPRPSPPAQLGPSLEDPSPANVPPSAHVPLLVIDDLDPFLVLPPPPPLVSVPSREIRLRVMGGMKRSESLSGGVQAGAFASEGSRWERREEEAELDLDDDDPKDSRVGRGLAGLGSPKRTW